MATKRILARRTFHGWDWPVMLLAAFIIYTLIGNSLFACGPPRETK